MKCMFSGEDTSNEEHVLPRWMQRRFGLKNMTYNLPNGTQITYRNCKVPVAQEYNSAFGKIEDKIARGVAMPQEIYLWAMKIHIGLIYRNSNLKVDIRSPASPSFWPLDDFGQEIWLFQKLYACWAQGGSISPHPLGSVFRMKALTPTPSFDFIHNMQAGTLFFQLGDEVIFVILYDQGRATTSNMAAQFEYHRGVTASFPLHEQEGAALVAQRVWACESSYFLYRSIRGFSFVATASDFHIVPPLSWPPTRPSEESELAMFCQSFGLKLERFGGEVGHEFSSLTADDIRELARRGRPEP